MKNKIRLPHWMFLLLFTPSIMRGQALTAKNFFSSDTVSAVYLGMDFTLAKLINDEASNAKVIQLTQFNGINDLIIKESKKYDVQEAFHRVNWTVDVKEVENRNDKANPDSLKSSNEADLTRLTSHDIENLVAHFNFGTHKGYGVLLVMEAMSKTAKKASVWFLLVDMGAGRVLASVRVEGKLGNGFGFRNYWASAIKSAISEFKSEDYNQWKTGTSTN